MKVEKLEADAGSKLELEVLMIADGDKVEMGNPLLSKKLGVEVVAQGRHKKIEVVHYKAKSRYTKRSGHRQPFTEIKIGKIA